MSAHRARPSMSAPRSRHSRANHALRPVGDILARVTVGSHGTACVPSQRSGFAVAAAGAVGAGAVAASMTGGFPTIQAPTLLGLNDTESFPRIIEPAAMDSSAPVALPSARPAVIDTPGSTASYGTVMAGDLHQADARQIAALSRSASLTRRNGSASLAPSSSGAAVSELAMPTTIRGVPISGLAGTKTAGLALRAAITKIGLPYVWGAAGPNAFDCSGLVLWAYKQLGVNLPHSSAQQSQMGKPVSRANLRPGDLVFFYSPVSHEGIYLGNNKVFNAFDSGQPLKVSDMSRMPFHSARRL